MYIWISYTLTRVLSIHLICSKCFLLVCFYKCLKRPYFPECELHGPNWKKKKLSPLLAITTGLQGRELQRKTLLRKGVFSLHATVACDSLYKSTTLRGKWLHYRKNRVRSSRVVETHPKPGHFPHWIQPCEKEKRGYLFLYSNICHTITAFNLKNISHVLKMKYLFY